VIRRGEIRWFRFSAPDKKRPVLVLGRDDGLPSLSQLIATLPEARWEQVKAALLDVLASDVPSGAAKDPGRKRTLRREKCAEVRDLPGLRPCAVAARAC